ncbi:MAG TPA: response regulator transcription factor [Clostridia bacterium]|nr:response regulator transcription factor [Clostridia bacterium]
MQQNEFKILVVDDEEKIVEVVKSYLDASGYKVYAAYNCKEAQDIFDKVNPDLLILDLMLPDMTGEELCTKLRKKSRVPIIMLTAKIDEVDILKGLDIGADDYITKPFSTKQLVARVKALLRRSAQEVIPLTDILSFNEGDLNIDSLKHEVKKQGDVVSLTPNEYKLLMSMVKYPQKVFTREELIVLALGGEFDGFDRTIDSHIKNLRQKIETDTKDPKYIITVHGVGYRFGGE